jgi:hypothetical protein
MFELYTSAMPIIASIGLYPDGRTPAYVSACVASPVLFVALINAKPRGFFLTLKLTLLTVKVLAGQNPDKASTNVAIPPPVFGSVTAGTS